jgi:hypothetical protein
MHRAAPLARLIGGLPAAALLAVLLTACQTTGETPPDISPDTAAQADPAPAPAPETTALPAPALPTPASPPVPHIYMALQSDDAGRPVSAIFAIDAARDNTPSDDPAIRITPEGGRCNPQEMRSYNFPPEDAARPVVGETEQAQGLTAGGLPDFMAVSVTESMLERGLASDREDTRALNICTRKLWEELVLSENAPGLVAGQ